MDNTIDCITAISQMMAKRKVDQHSVQQLLEGLRQEQKGQYIWYEHLYKAQVASSTGVIDVSRKIDVLTKDLFRLVHTEIKTGYPDPGAALKEGQMLQDAALAIEISRKLGISLQNVWKLTDHVFNGIPESLKNRMNSIIGELANKGFSFADLQKAIGSFHVVDKLGNVIKTELDQSGTVIFKDAMGVLLGSDGSMAQTALKASKNSPNFLPAMEVLFGPSGKVAHAATEAAGHTNLDPALQGFEKKLESGVGQALDQAGKAVSKISAKELADKLSGGVTALGGMISSIPQMYQSVKELGEVWSKPLNNTEDYMNLMTKLGGVVSQAGGVLQAFTGITQIAAAAQAVFNAIMALNPVVLVVIAVVALIAAVTLLIVYWDKVKAAIRDNPWLQVVAVMFGVIGVIVLVIAYWDEVKLAVLRAANFISIQAQRIGAFFMGIGRLAGQVWNYIAASLENVGIGILNSFIKIGAGIQNFFIGVINWIVDKYNAVVDNKIGRTLGFEKMNELPKVDVQAKLIPPKEVPKIDVDAAFAHGPIEGGLESSIAKQEEAVAKARAEDEKRRAEKSKANAAAEPAAPALPTALPPALPTADLGGFAGRPMIPPTGGPGGGPVDQSVHVGAINISINADKLEADAGKLLSDQIIAQIQARLGALRSEQDFRVGARPSTP